MNIDYGKAYVKAGKEAKAVDASKIIVDGVTLSEIVEQHKALKQAFKEQADVYFGTTE